MHHVRLIEKRWYHVHTDMSEVGYQIISGPHPNRDDAKQAFENFRKKVVEDFKNGLRSVS